MVNERLLDENVMGYGEDELAPFFCECGAAGCLRWIRISATEFHDWLAEPGSNLVAPGHEDPNDQVVLRTVRYVVVFGSGL
jgi:hypothetical protein